MRTPCQAITYKAGKKCFILLQGVNLMSVKEPLAAVLSGANAAYLAELYSKWAVDPASVDSSFDALFSSFDEEAATVFHDALGASWAPNPHTARNASPIRKNLLAAAASRRAVHSKSQQAASDSLRALQLIRAYRVNGHLEAQLDPLHLQRPHPHLDLDPATYGFTPADMDRPILMGDSIGPLLGTDTATIRQLHSALREAYCGPIGAEIMHVQNMTQRRWLMERMESTGWKNKRSSDERLNILSQLIEAEAFESFCHKRYVGTKRFGLEGGESAIVALHALIERAVEEGVHAVALGMAHRGRLNTLVNVVGKPCEAVFSELSGGSSQPGGLSGSGDVKYHLGARTERIIAGKKVQLVLHPNPSHLEAVGPVVVGSIRAAQDSDGSLHSRHHHMGILIHGDAAFSGQGVVYETMAMSQLIGYRTGGTVHVVINNQIGFTTVSAHAFSGLYGTDIAKSVQAPILHVNGDDPEAVRFCARLAADFRQQFATDIVVEIVCYRRHGHNETDEPSFTQPIMYQAIRQHLSTRVLYARQLMREGLLGEESAEAMWQDALEKLQKAYLQAQSYAPQPIQQDKKKWSGQVNAFTNVRTGISDAVLVEIGKALNTVPSGFAIHPRILRQMEARKEVFAQKGSIDWATAEALAFGSLLLEGARIRLSGEDCQRGTFSQRHAVLIDQKNQNEYVPLNNIAPHQAGIEVYNSLLSEFGVLGFEYGYSLYAPHDLVLWEAQFGDFANGAQVIIDQFIASGESKWQRFSGLVMLLPHGYEGQGPEHSSARLERYLQLCAENNIQVCNMTTPANYFHVLRRQIHQSVRKPLVLMTPKSLLRHPMARSPWHAFGPETAFIPIIGDKSMNVKEVKRVVLCSGKVYYDLLARRDEKQIKDVALIRLEQFYPFPFHQLVHELAPYKKADFIWCQEEPSNMGGWSFLVPFLENVLEEMEAGKKTQPRKFHYVGRKAAASPATGLLAIHQKEQAALVDQALGLSLF